MPPAGRYTFVPGRSIGSLKSRAIFAYPREDSANDIVSRGIRDYPRISVYHFVLMILKCLTFEVGIEVESNANIEQLNCSISYDSEKNLFRYKRNTIRIMIINKFVHVNFSRFFGIN